MYMCNKLKDVHDVNSKYLCDFVAEELFREASHIDFVHEKRHMDVGGVRGLKNRAKFR